MLSENVQQTGKKITTLTTTEETFERRHSIRSIQAMGNAFKTEDEEEVFDNIYLGIVFTLQKYETLLIKFKDFVNVFFFFFSF